MVDLAPVPNYVDMFAQSYQAGREQARQKGIQNALSMAPTDPSGAAAALTQYGEFGGANALMQNAAQQRTLKVQGQVAPQIAAGDYAGAAKTAAAGGQFDMASQIGQLNKQQMDQAQQHSDIIARAAFGLSQQPQAARAGLFEQMKPHLMEMGFKPEELANVDLSDQGLATIAHQAMSVKEAIASQQKDKELSEQSRHNTAVEAQTKAEQDATNAYRKSELAQGAERLGIERDNANRAQWQVLQDPGNGNQPYRFNAATGAATTMDGSQSYTPKGAAKLGTNNPRSMAALAAAQFSREHPDATAEDMAAFAADYGKKISAAKAFATGKQGQTVNSINVGVDHLNTAQQAADALQNGNIQLFNKIAKDWQAATGKPAPTNFDAVKQMVADEVVKSVTGGAGGVGDREKAQAILSRVNSPDQLSGAITQIKHLMTGQLNGLRLQYKNSTGLDDFETHLLPATRAELENYGAPAGAGGQGSGNRPSLQSIFGH